MYTSFSASKAQQQYSSNQNHKIFQSEHKQYGSIHSTSNSKTFCKNLNFSGPITPHQSTEGSLNFSSALTHEQKFNHLLMKLKNIEAKSQKMKLNNQKNFNDFKGKLNNLCKTHQKHCQNQTDVTCI